MALNEVTIDSVRLASISGEWVIILKRKDSEQYLPIYVGPSQANILKRELMGARFSEPKIYEHFLAGNDIVRSNLESVVVEESKNGVFHAKLLLIKGGDSFKTDCPVAVALALGFRKKARILVDESSFQEAGTALS
jgi:hypothetical protein